jgi:uncharacterized protein
MVGSWLVIHIERILRLSLDLPIIVEVVAPEERVQEVLPELDDMIDGGLVTLEPRACNSIPPTKCRC